MILSGTIENDFEIIESMNTDTLNSNDIFTHITEWKSGPISNLPGCLIPLLSIVYSPRIAFNIPSKVLQRHCQNVFSHVPSMDLYKGLLTLAHVSHSHDTVLKFINQFPPLIVDILRKKIRPGFALKTLQKLTSPNPFIDTVKFTLGRDFQGQALDSEWLLSRKFDGMRILFHGYRFYTRQSKEYKFSNIWTDLMTNGIQEYILDGELAHVGEDNTDNFNETMSMAKRGDDSKLKFYIFDVFTHDEYETGKSSLNLKQRLDRIPDICSSHVAKVRHEPYTEDLFVSMMKNASELGNEGIVARHLNAPVFQRSNMFLKVKNFHTREMLVVGWAMSVVENVGIATLSFTDGEIVQSVGTGLSVMDRHVDPSIYIGKRAVIQYLREANGSLYIPSIVRWIL